MLTEEGVQKLHDDYATHTLMAASGDYGMESQSTGMETMLHASQLHFTGQIFLKVL